MIKYTDDIKDEKYFLFFSSPYCAPCKSVIPDINKLIEEKNIKVYYVDVIENANIVNNFEISSTPTLYEIVDGNIEKRYNNIAEIRKFIKEYE